MELQALLDRARAGDRAAWNQILERLRPWLRGLLRPRLGQDADGSDLTQEVQLRMDRGFARFRGETSGQLYAWAYRIAINVLYDYYRVGRTPPEPLPEAVPAPVPEAPAADAEDMARLQQALEYLPARERQVIEGRLFEGLTCAELARRMGELPGTVRTWCLRAVEDLSRRLGDRP
jgi:RNA polymerase sigma-70 factor (ECF subfamily)